ncbi:MAG: caspase family protein [Deltaproteobacteria bacterium]|uniref:Caspase family protein n=1 Tax=Candidatus Desulfacyla euxinica TaxID=2841693 RepID=A0A8J6T763_9DELT|nr:caspase family protein [Candidatus Desulfacyla euxinica]
MINLKVCRVCLVVVIIVSFTIGFGVPYATATSNCDRAQHLFFAAQNFMHKDRAAHNYLKAIRLCPGFIRPYELIGNYYRKEGFNGKAIEFFTKAAELGSVNYKLYYLLASLFYKNGDLDMAHRHLNKSLSIRSDYPKALALKAKIERATDTTGPQIRLYEPATPHGIRVSFRNEIMTVRGLVTDMSGVGWLKINNQEALLEKDGRFLIDIPLIVGLNNMQIEATDKAGNRSTLSVSVKREAQPKIAATLSAEEKKAEMERKKRLAAEKERREKIEAELAEQKEMEARMARQKELEAEQAKQKAEEAERVRRKEIETKIARQKKQKEELARQKAAKAESARLEALEAKRIRQEKLETEQARKKAEEARLAKKKAEEAERARRKTLAAIKAKKEKLIAELAKAKTLEAELAKQSAAAMGPIDAGRPGTASQFYRKSFAVVVGINEYEKWSVLEFGIADAKAVKARLEEEGFDDITVILGHEATQRRILTALYDYLPKNVQRDDRVVFYFAGHGQTHELPNGGKEGYIIPVDAGVENYTSTGISMGQIRGLSSRIAAKHILYIMDSCYSGLGFSRGMITVSPGPGGYLRKISSLRVVQIITAGGKGEQVQEKEGHGLFTTYFLKALEGKGDLNKDNVVTGTELGAYLRPTVSNASNQAQTPLYGRLEGEGEFLFFIGKK